MNDLALARGKDPNVKPGSASRLTVAIVLVRDPPFDSARPLFLVHPPSSLSTPSPMSPSSTLLAPPSSLSSVTYNHRKR